GLPSATRCPYTTLFRSKGHIEPGEAAWQAAVREVGEEMGLRAQVAGWAGSSRFTVDGEEKLVAYLTVTAEPGPDWDAHLGVDTLDRKSTRLNSSHVKIS